MKLPRPEPIDLENKKILQLGSKSLIAVLKELAPFERIEIQPEINKKELAFNLTAEVWNFAYFKPLFGIKYFPFPRPIRKTKRIAQLAISKEHGYFKAITARVLREFKDDDLVIGDALREKLGSFVTYIYVETDL